MNRNAAIALTALAVLASGCSNIPYLTGKKVDYQSAQVEDHSLEVPPDLVEPTTDGRYNIPQVARDTAGSATWSAYTESKAGNAAQSAANAAVLPQTDAAHLAHDGPVRYLVVQGNPDSVWPHLVEFWKQQGFKLDVANMTGGIMVTNWNENRAKMPQGEIGKLFNKVFDFIGSSDTMDRFRTRLERGAQPGTTEIYVAMEGVEQQPMNQSEGDQFVWMRRPPDPQVEDEMLNRMLVSFGVPANQAKADVKNAPDTVQMASMATMDDHAVINLVDPFDRAWRRVGLALDRLGFTVEDHDRKAGIYYIRYVDTDTPDNSGKSSGWLSKLEFWKSSNDTPAKQNRFQVQIKPNGEASYVELNDANGKPDNSKLGKRILNLLYTDLK